MMGGGTADGDDDVGMADGDDDVGMAGGRTHRFAPTVSPYAGYGFPVFSIIK